MLSGNSPVFWGILDLLMDSSLWIERFGDDESLTDNLRDEQAIVLLKWAEERLDLCNSESEAEAVIAKVREINRRVGEGERFPDLVAPLCNESPDPGSSGSEPPVS